MLINREKRTSCASSRISTTLTLVLTDHWFEEIKSGRKTHEYRVCSEHWHKRLGEYEQHPERMTFSVKSVTICDGRNTDLRVKDYVFDIELGARL